MADGGASMEIDSGSAVPGAAAGSSSAVVVSGDKKKPRFEIKKYNAVALWAWGEWSLCNDSPRFLVQVSICCSLCPSPLAHITLFLLPRCMAVFCILTTPSLMYYSLPGFFPGAPFLL